MNRIKWFLGEFFVVVAGVLVAFLLNGWWMSIKESEKEKKYLEQIYDDLNATILEVKEAEQNQRNTLHAASQLLAISYSTAEYSDSLVSRYINLSMNFSPVSHVSATLSSLVSTGDLQLISDDSLRLVLGELVSGLHAYTTTNDHMAFFWLIPAYERFADNVGLADFRYQVVSDSQLTRLSSDSLRGYPDPSDLKKPRATDLSLLLEDVGFRQNLLKLQIAQANLYRVHTSFLGGLEKTRDKLEVEMRRQGIRKERRARPDQVSE